MSFADAEAYQLYILAEIDYAKGSPTSKVPADKMAA
jgi:hypothetical protein